MCQLVQDGIIMRPNNSFASEKNPLFQWICPKTRVFFMLPLCGVNRINCFLYFASSRRSPEIGLENRAGKKIVKIGQKGKYWKYGERPLNKLHCPQRSSESMIKTWYCDIWSRSKYLFSKQTWRPEENNHVFAQLNVTFQKYSMY